MTTTELQGRYILGQFQGTEPVRRRDGSEVPGMFRLVVSCDFGARTWDYKLVYFDVDRDGAATTIAKQLANNPPTPGEIVAVRFSSKASVSNGKGYVDDTAIGIVSGGI